jgi:hypothetical protein
LVAQVQIVDVCFDGFSFFFGGGREEELVGLMVGEEAG